MRKASPELALKLTKNMILLKNPHNEVAPPTDEEWREGFSLLASLSMGVGDEETHKRKAFNLCRRYARRAAAVELEREVERGKAAPVLHDKRCAITLHGPESACNCPMAAFGSRGGAHGKA